MPDTSRAARAALFALIDDAGISGLTGGLYDHEPAPGIAVTPFATVISAGAAFDQWQLTVRLYVRPVEPDVASALDIFDDLTQAIENALQSSSQFEPPGYNADYDTELGMYLAEWQLRTGRSDIL